jgi:PAS domain S-box-containing protein
VFWIATADLSQCLYINPAFEQIWGRPLAEAYGNPRGFLGAIHPEDRERIAKNFEQRRREDVAFDHEYRIVRPDGTIRWIWGRGQPIRDELNGDALYMGIAQDITERKQMESELAAVAERFALVSQATNDGVFDWDMRTNTVWWSDAYYTVFGIDRSTPPSVEGWLSCVHPGDRDRVMAGFERACAHKETMWGGEYRFIRPSDGKQLYVIDRAYVLYDQAGRPVRMVGALTDLTTRRDLEEQLRHAQKMEAIGQLAGGIAHDFNNILQAVTVELALASRTPGLPEKAAAHVAESLASLERAASLTRQLLVFSRREAMRPSHIDLNAKVADLTRMVRRMIGEDIALHLDLAPGSIPIDADPAMIDQVLVNLALNARDAMPSGGTLAISTSVDDTRTACIVVRDTGAGIPAEHLPRIFEPFFTTKEASRGTGLGLATVHGIIEQHRGRIEASSEPGRGATFRIYLPVSDVAAVRAHPAVELPRARGTETILLVEDDDSVRRALRELLEDAGYGVVEAERGAAALARLEDGATQIGLVLTDLVMPDGMSGKELAGRITSRWPGVRIVFMSGYSRERVADLGEHEVLHKPVDPSHLLDAVRASLDRA